MIYTDNIEQLKKSMTIKDSTSKGKHIIGKSSSFLPFKTRNPERAKFSSGTMGLIGETVRFINNKELRDDFDSNKNISNIMESVSYEKEDETYLYNLIQEHLLSSDGSTNIFHYDLYNYVKVTNGKESVGEKEIAQFIYDVLLNNIDELKSDFDDNSQNDVITRVILEGLNKSDSLIEKESNNVFKNKLPFIENLAIEDFRFLMKNKDFFLKYFEPLVCYYYFFYITQFCIKSNKKFDTNYDSVEKIYYLLDWEKASKSRKSVNQGYKYIKSEGQKLLTNMNVVEHLNFLMGVRNYNLVEIEEYFNDLNSEEQVNYLETIREWINIYKSHFNQEIVSLDLDLYKLVNELEKSIKIDPAVISRYFLSIEEIGKQYFLKSRGGAYGYMLNLTKEVVLMITSVCIKKDKITLNALLEEYNKRGIFLDKDSKELLVEFLDKLNLIDKKSDSGDAQYVKSIL